MKFVGRARELALLERQYANEAGSFVPIYGRRRVGKTALLRHFCSQRPTLFFVGKEVPDALQRKEFLVQAAGVLDEPLLAEIEPPSWKEILNRVRQRWPGHRRLILVLDEFQWTSASSPGLPSVLQELWDGGWENDRGVMLVLCGSYVGFMEREVLGSRSPLFGRRTAQLHLQPFNYKEARGFHPSYSLKDAARTYFICGGVPAYLRTFDSRRSVEQNIREELLHEFAPLHREADFLLREELREVHNYQAILSVLSTGSLPQREIVARTSISAGSMPYYLSQLEGLGYVRKRYPLTDNRPPARLVRYELSDSLLRFWFRFVFPSLSVLSAAGPRDTFRGQIAPHLDAYFGSRFEDLCREALPSLYAREGVSASFQVGQFWSKEVQIDVVGHRDDNFTDLGECKWGKITPSVVARELETKVGKYPNPRNATILRRVFTRDRVRRPPEGLRWHCLADLYKDIENN